MGIKKKVVRKALTPEWVLSEEWGVGRDTWNWKLYHKVGVDKTKWKVIGYYRSPDQLLESLMRKVGRVEDRGGRELIAHLENCLAVAMACSDELAKLVGEEWRVK